MNIFEKVLRIPDAVSGRLFVDPQRNGEYRFARSYVRSDMVIIDVGANIGDYTRYVLNLAERVRVHCFEPISSTYFALERNLQEHVNTGQVLLNRMALGAKLGSVSMHVYGVNAGSNSIYYHTYHADKSAEVQRELVEMSTLDSYISSRALDKVDLLKIDVEGHELDVIRGAEQGLRQGTIRGVQFEYNDFWRESRHSLIDMLETLHEFNSFSFYRLTPWGKWRVTRFSRGLNDYKHSNYLAILMPRQH